MTTLEVRIAGHVQGVWFRAWTREEAVARGLSGWVRNEEDGTVSAVISGPDEAVADMVAAFREGPPAARVETVETAPALPPREGGFRILR